MKRYRKISIFLLSLSTLIGLIRGYRMTLYPDGNSILFPYPKDMIKASIFSNYTVLGWIVFSLVGIFSGIVLGCVLFKTRRYAYLIIAEGIFTSFFLFTHFIFTGFSYVHIIFFPLCIGMIVIGILQTPREF